MTPLLWLVWCAPRRGSRSSTSTRRPRIASSRAVARPTMPPPTTATSIEEIERRPHDGLGVDLVVLVELADVARLAEALYAEAGDRGARGAGQEGERVRVAVQQRDERLRAAEQTIDRAGVTVAEPSARLQRAEQQVGARDAHDLGLHA